MCPTFIRDSSVHAIQSHCFPVTSLRCSPPALPSLPLSKLSTAVRGCECLHHIRTINQILTAGFHICANTKHIPIRATRDTRRFLSLKGNSHYYYLQSLLAERPSWSLLHWYRLNSCKGHFYYLFSHKIKPYSFYGWHTKRLNCHAWDSSSIVYVC